MQLWSDGEMGQKKELELESSRRVEEEEGEKGLREREEQKEGGAEESRKS